MAKDKNNKKERKKSRKRERDSSEERDRATKLVKLHAELSACLRMQQARFLATRQ